MSLREIQAAEAGTHFPELLDEVERGETILITRDGRPVARLVPEVATRAAVREAIEAIKEFGRNMPTSTAAERRALIDEGRTY